MTKAVQVPKRGPFLQVVKSAVAIAAAWLVAPLLVPGPPPIFAAIAALLVVLPSVNQSLLRAIEFSVGVTAGVLFASVLGLLLGSQTWVILVAVTVGLVLAWLLRMTVMGANQIAISAFLVLALGVGTPEYAVDRVVETIIGAIIGFIVNFLIVPPVAVAPARERVDALGEGIASALERLAAAILAKQDAAQRTELLTEARGLLPALDAAEDAIAAGDDSLTLNPRGRRHRAELAELKSVLATLTPIVTQVRGMTRAVADRYEESLGGDPVIQDIAEQMRRAAHDVRLTLRRADPSEHTLSIELPALTSPLTFDRPPQHWILVGALTEDLRRIHDVLTQAS